MNANGRHPCFDKKSAAGCGRIHLPVAPKCNIQCNYCNRKYDCVNESRPGVTSGVLTPVQAVDYLCKVMEKEPRITVVGIAGPGDPFANAGRTLETIRLAREQFPDMLFCLSTNGLGLPPYMDEVAALGVTHMTVTINAIDPAIGGRIYSWVRDGNVVYRGERAAEVLISRQLNAVRGLKERGLTVKVNSIVIPGVNDDHLEAVSREVAALGADIQNVIPLKPTAGTPFSGLPEPGPEMVTTLRKATGSHLPQMTHCKRCRADAVGLLSHDRSSEFGGLLQGCSMHKPADGGARPFVAVATREGMLVNQHLGEAEKFHIFTRDGAGYRLVEERVAPKPGCGPKRWKQLARTLEDCRAVLCGAAGQAPQDTLRENGVEVHIVSGLVNDALDAVYSGNIATLSARKGGIGGGGCSGMGAGGGCC